MGEARSAVGFVGNLPLCPRKRTLLKMDKYKRIILNRLLPHVGNLYGCST